SRSTASSNGQLARIAATPRARVGGILVARAEARCEMDQETARRFGLWMSALMLSVTTLAAGCSLGLGSPSSGNGSQPPTLDAGGSAPSTADGAVGVDGGDAPPSPWIVRRDAAHRVALKTLWRTLAQPAR